MRPCCDPRQSRRTLARLRRIWRRRRRQAAAAAAFDDGVEDGTAFAGLGFAEEQPVFLAQGGGTNGVFDQVVVDLEATVVKVSGEEGPVGQGVIAARESVLGPDHQHTIESVNGLADLLHADDRLQESLQLLWEYGAKSLSCFAGVRFNLAGHECLSGNLNAARRLIAEEIAADPEKKQQALEDDDLAAIRDFIQSLGETESI